MPAATSPASYAGNPALEAAPPGTLIRVNLDKGTRIGKLKAGAEINGAVSRPVYAVDQLAIPQGSRMRFVIQSVEKKPLPTRAFTDRLSEILSFGILKERITVLHLQSAEIQFPDGNTERVNATVASSSDVINVRAKGNTVTLANGAFTNVSADIPALEKTQATVRKIKEIKHPALTLSLNGPLKMAAAVTGAAPARAAASKEGPAVMVRSGTPARLVLLTRIDANKAKTGDRFEARLEEPILENGEVLLPEGAHFYGTVSRVKHATIGRQSANLLLHLDRVSVGGGPESPISAPLTSIDIDETSRLRMDEEGGLKPRHPSKTEIGRDIALAWVPGKAFNDAYDNFLPITANAGGLAIWAGMFLIHKGHDVYIPAETEIQITFSRDTVIATGVDAAK